MTKFFQGTSTLCLTLLTPLTTFSRASLYVISIGLAAAQPAFSADNSQGNADKALVNNAVEEPIAPSKFIESVYANSFAEIESGKLALDRSASPAVKKFARYMIDDHATINNELAEIVHDKNLHIDDEYEIRKRAESAVHEQHADEAFDSVYAANQITAHENTIRLFEQATQSPDADISMFARTNLPKLRNHLQRAKQLADTTNYTANR